MQTNFIGGNEYDSPCGDFIDDDDSDPQSDFELG